MIYSLITLTSDYIYSVNNLDLFQSLCIIMDIGHGDQVS